MKLDDELEARILSTPGVRVNGAAKPAIVPVGETLTEKEFMAQVVALAKRSLWAVYHTYDSRKSAAGFPDLTFARDRLVFAELKTETGRLTGAQELWIERLKGAGAEVHVWRPSDRQQIERTLA